MNSNALWVVTGAIGVWLIVEWGLGKLILRLRNEFQWLITPADELPEFDPLLIEKYSELSFDKDLGWVRRPGTQGREETAQGEKTFTLDKNGCRTNPDYAGKPSRIAAFGDSFTFCRLVDDRETWPYYLSGLADTNVLNFGVGNYGIDQAVLRLDREIGNLESEFVILGFVPETISRIHSYWRHYFEYGNILAFKPRFTLSDGKLTHHPPAIKRLEDFTHYADRLKEIQALDIFYKRKFRRDLLFFPHLPKIIRQWRRTIPIFFHLIKGKLTGAADGGFREAFQVVMRENARISALLYENHEAKELLVAVVKRFVATCEAAGCKPILLIIPQPVDLERISKGRQDYSEFYQSLAAYLPVLDLTDRFRAILDPSSLYIEGKLGPHPSPLGNRLIAEAIMDTFFLPSDPSEAPGK